MRRGLVPLLGVILLVMAVAGGTAFALSRGETPSNAPDSGTQSTASLVGSLDTSPAGTESFPVGSGPIAVLPVGDDIWVTNFTDGTLSKLRASDGATLGTFNVGRSSGLALGRNVLWVSRGPADVVRMVNPVDGSVLGTFAVGDVPVGIAFDGANVWVANNGSNNVTKLDASGNTLGTFPVGGEPIGVLFDGTNIWVSNFADDTVTKLDPSNGKALGTFSVAPGDGPEGLAFDGTNIWVTTARSDTVVKLDTFGKLLGTFPVGDGPRRLAFDGANMWVVNSFSANVVKLRASDGFDLGSFDVGAGAQGIAFDGANIWVTNFGDGTVTKKPAFPAAGPDPVPQTVNFQGHLTDALGNPIIGDIDVTFRLYDHATEGPALWGETQTTTAEDGLISIQMGSIEPLALELFGGTQLWLGIQMGDDPEMLPRHPVSSVPYSLVAATAGRLECTGCIGTSELANGAVTSSKLQGGAVTGVKLAAGSVTTNKIASNAVTNDKLAPNSVESTKIVDRSVTAADLANNAVNSSKIADGSVQPKDVAFSYAGSSAKSGVATDSDLLDGLDSSELALVEHRHCWLELGLFTATESLGIGSDCLTVNAVDGPGSGPGPLIEGPALDFVGVDTSVALGTDGLPIISYAAGHFDLPDFFDKELRVAHCNDLECSSATITTIDSAGEVGTFSSIAIGVDGLTVISYYDETNEDLKIAHCNNVACTSSLAFTLFDLGSVGKFSSIGIGGDGFPVISYSDETNLTIRMAHCLNVACTGGSSTVIDSSEIHASFGSLAVGSDGLPIVFYEGIQPTTSDPIPLKVAHCNNATCTDTTINIVDHAATPGSVAIGADGLPLLNYGKASAIKVAHCNDVSCTSSSITTPIPDVGSFAYDNAMAIGPDGLPKIAYSAGFDGLAMAHCSDAVCTDARIVILEHSFSGEFSAAVAGSGELIVAFDVIDLSDFSKALLKVARCNCVLPPD